MSEFINETELAEVAELAAFEELGLSPEVVRALTELGITRPTDIQMEAIPQVLSGRDILGRSATGSGKTLAFGGPAVDMVDEEVEGSVQVLVLCPTRELATQVSGEMLKFRKYKQGVRIVTLYGGDSMEKQIMLLKKRPSIVVGTPGRVMDHMRRKTLKLQDLRMIVLDEADEMLNMGFREDIETILQDIPEEHQTLLFSATMPPAIKSLTKEYQNDPAIIEIGRDDRPVDTVKQYYTEVPLGKKDDVLELFLHRYDPHLSIIFCNTKRMVDSLTETLNTRGFRAMGLHGDMKQIQRTAVMTSFKHARTPILIATDVAARGIDVENVEAVFNYDVPLDTEYYIHRLGRTGRAGKGGVSYTFVSGREQRFAFNQIIRSLKTKVEQLDIPTAGDIYAQKRTEWYNEIVSHMEGEPSKAAQGILEQFAADGYTQADAVKALLELYLKDKKMHLPQVNVPKKPTYQIDGDMATLKITIGRAQGVRPNYLVGAIAEYSGLPGKNIGKIDLYQDFSTVQVPAGAADSVIEAVNGVKINGRKVTVTTFRPFAVDKEEYGRLRREQKEKDGTLDERRDRRDRKDRKDRKDYKDRKDRKEHKEFKEKSEGVKEKVFSVAEETISEAKHLFKRDKSGRRKKFAADDAETIQNHGMDRDQILKARRQEVIRMSREAQKKKVKVSLDEFDVDKLF